MTGRQVTGSTGRGDSPAPQSRIQGWMSMMSTLPLAALILLWVIAFRDKHDGDYA